jgi:hypothetical protein
MLKPSLSDCRLRGEFRTALLAGRRAVASEGATAARRELGLE